MRSSFSWCTGCAYEGPKNEKKNDFLFQVIVRTVGRQNEKWCKGSSYVARNVLATGQIVPNNICTNLKLGKVFQIEWVNIKCCNFFFMFLCLLVRFTQFICSSFFSLSLCFAYVQCWFTISVLFAEIIHKVQQCFKLKMENFCIRDERSIYCPNIHTRMHAPHPNSRKIHRTIDVTKTKEEKKNHIK